MKETPDVVLVHRQNKEAHIIDVKTCPPKQFVKIRKKKRITVYVEKVIDEYLNNDELWSTITGKYIEYDGSFPVKRSCIIIIPEYCISEGLLIDDTRLLD